jgi:hypothetical protein
MELRCTHNILQHIKTMVETRSDRWNDADLQEDFLVLDDMITKKKSLTKADGKRR